MKFGRAAEHRAVAPAVVCGEVEISDLGLDRQDSILNSIFYKVSLLRAVLLREDPTMVERID